MEYILDAFGILNYQIYPIIGLYLLVSAFLRKKSLFSKYDERIIEAFKWLSILFLGLFMTKSILAFSIDDEVFSSIKRRMTGKYWFAYWIEPSFFILLSFFLILKRNWNSIRLVVGLLFLFKFHSIVILITSLHRDFLPSSWYSIFPLGNYFFPSLLKTIVVFIIIILIQKKMKTKDEGN